MDNLELKDNLITTTSGNLELDSFTNLVNINSDVQVSGDFQVSCDMVIQGTTTNTISENVLISANYLHNNSNYTTIVAQTGG